MRAWRPEQLFANVEKQDSGCWHWTAAIDVAGYGKVRWRGRDTLAHRATYEVAKGPIPKGLQVDHLCRVRRCVNPEHLEAVTPRENRRRAAAVITHCPQGHEYTPENSRFSKSGHRRCRLCANAQQREYLARRAQSPSISK